MYDYQPVHVEMPGQAMAHLAPTLPLSRLVVKRWKDGRWFVVRYERGPYHILYRELIGEMERFNEDYYAYMQARAERHVGR